MLAGKVMWVDEATATTENLAYVDDSGKAIIRVDNTTVVPADGIRNTVRTPLSSSLLEPRGDGREARGMD